MELFLQKNAKFSSAGGSAPRPPCLRQLGALPPDSHWPPAAGGSAPRPPKQPPPLRISGYAPAHDVLEQIVSQVNASPFYAIQLDESTDIAGLPQLSLFIRYISDGKVLEELLFCKPLHLHTRGEDIFKSIDGFFNENSISWDKCAGICTDGAAACTGINSGVVKRV